MLLEYLQPLRRLQQDILEGIAPHPEQILVWLPHISQQLLETAKNPMKIA
jgi:hypothetical protein